MLKLRHVRNGRDFREWSPRVLRTRYESEVHMNADRTPVPVSPNALRRFVRTFRLAWRLLMDSRISLLPKLIIPVATLIIISPIDLLNFIPIVGEVDDVFLFFLSILLFIEFCPRAIVDAHRAALDAEMGVPRANDENVVDGTYRVIDDDPAHKS